MSHHDQDQTQIPHARAGKLCPLMRKDMSKVCHNCGWWVGLHWTDAYGKIHEKWNCAQVMSALTNVDVSRAMAGVQSATESMRNETVKRSESPPTWAIQQIVQQSMTKALIDHAEHERRLMLEEEGQLPLSLPST